MNHQHREKPDILGSIANIKKINAEAEWVSGIRKSCKLKTTNKDSSAYCVYCRKESGSCAFEHCPIKE